MRWLIAVLVAVVVTIATGAGLLLWDPNIAKIDVVKTAGVTGGAVVALYALWLNDRRRRTDEARHEVERARADHDRARVADERFARAIELLGHDTTRVRVGALHALAGLARSRPDYTQTVLDILCAYLRRPFEGRDDEELEVRLTAQRLIADLLPHVDDEDAPRYDLNLTKARLEYFDLSHRQVGDLIARVAVLTESNGLHHMKIHGDLYLTDATVSGKLYIHDTEINGKAWFSRFKGNGKAIFTDTKFLGETKFAGATWAEEPEGLQCAG